MKSRFGFALEETNLDLLKSKYTIGCMHHTDSKVIIDTLSELKKEFPDVDKYVNLFNALNKDIISLTQLHEACLDYINLDIIGPKMCEKIAKIFQIVSETMKESVLDAYDRVLNM